jgi:hypothetical protein
MSASVNKAASACRHEHRLTPVENVRVLLDLPKGLSYSKGHTLEYTGYARTGQTRQACLFTGKAVGTGECRGQLQTGREPIGSDDAVIIITNQPAQSGSYGSYGPCPCIR